MKKWNILGVVVFQTELHKDIPVLEHYSSVNFLASLPMKRPATWIVLVGWYSWTSSTANHTAPYISVGKQLGDRMDTCEPVHVWSAKWLKKSDVRQHCYLKYFTLEKYSTQFVPLAQEPSHLDTLQTQRYFGQIVLHLIDFRIFLELHYFQHWPLPSSPSHALGANSLFVCGPQRKALGLLLLFHAQLLHY